MTNASETAVVVALSAAYGGWVIARRDGRVVLIKGAIPGERVRIRIDERKAGYDTATVIGLEEASPHRVEPACGHFGACGGCHLQYLSHAGQLALKQDVLSDCLTRIGGADLILSPPLLGDDPWAYRVRGQFKVAGRTAGFFREKSRDIVDVAWCPLMTGRVNERLRAFRETLGSYSDGRQGQMHIAEAHITCGDVPVLLVKTGQGRVTPREMRRMATRLVEAGFAGVTVEHPQGDVVSEGALWTTFVLSHISYSVSPLTFLQSHWRLNQAVVEFLRNSLGPLRGKRVVDLYAGAGNFSLPLCVEAEEVISVEAHEWAVRDGRRNVSLNCIANCGFVGSKAEQWPCGGYADILILDPPRTGLTNRVIEQIVSLRAGKIVYISCNPATLARDLKKLLRCYRVESVRAIDFFPQTYHVEAIAFLVLR